MQVVKVFFTRLIVVLCVVLVGDTIKTFVRKYKKHKANKQKKNDEDKQQVIEQKEDNDKN